MGKHLDIREVGMRHYYSSLYLMMIVLRTSMEELNYHIYIFLNANLFLNIYILFAFIIIHN